MMESTLTKSNIRLSKFGLGAMNLPLDDIVTSEAILTTAIENDITYIDTADLYQKGQNESLIGTFLKNNQLRQEVTLLSKVGNEFNMHNDEVKWNPSKQYIKEAIKASLKRLQTDYLDLYLLHGGMIEDHKDETIDAFETLKKEGIIRAYGISSIRPNVIDYYIKHSNIDVIMMQLNAFDNRPLDFLNDIYKKDIKLLTRGTLSKGLLTEKYQDIVNQKFNKGFLDFTENELLTMIIKLQNTFDLPIQTIALMHNLLYTDGALVCGASKLEQLKSNIKHYNQAVNILNTHDPNNLKLTFEEVIPRLHYKEHLR